jgi:radical SAM superfamily enzyme YgiQ (UPF0313 family)
MTRPASGRREQRTVLLVNPNRMQPPVAPLALDYLADALAQHAFKVDLLDLCFSADVARDVRSYFKVNEPLAVALTLRNTDDTYFASQDFFVPQYRELADLLKAETDAPIIMGGSGFSIAPEEVLAYCGLDMGVFGEGELALPLVVEGIAAGGYGDPVPGLVHRRNGRFHRNPHRYVDLSRIPTPTRGWIDNRRYFTEGGMGGIETKRGCPKKCIYCADPVGKGDRLRLRSPQSVADEIEALAGMGVDHLHFCDSEFNIPEEHARSVCRELASRGLGDRVRWYTYASPVGFTSELAALCRAAGCAGINFGVDSGSDSILRRLGRDFLVEDIERTARACRAEGIASMFDLLLGGPGETRQTLEETVKAMKRIGPDRIGTSLGVRVVPQTRLAAMIREQGPVAENLGLHGTVVDNDGFLAPVFYLSPELGPDAAGYLSRLIGGDERFFFASPAEAGTNYNYNDNTVLVNAIRAGYRGAFWDILRRLKGEG